MTTHAIDHHTASDCPNCGADVSGNYCHQCGQETVLHPPSIMEFLHEFIGHYVALESKLWQTLKLLVLQPGALTREYMAGRRVRYIEPLRVYLTFSLIFFASFKFMTEEHQFGNVHIGGGASTPAKAAAKAPSPPSTPAPAASGQAAEKSADKAQPVAATQDATDAADDDDEDLGKQIRSAIDADKRKDRNQGQAGAAKDSETHSGVSNFVLEKVADAADSDKTKLKAAIFGYAPYAVFALMPVFALYLKLLYLGSGRRYGEHLLFALHTNAFAFLMMTVLLFIPGGVPYVGKLLFLWLAVYLPIAMRKVYGGSRRMTFVRWCVVMFLHLISITFASVFVVYAAVSH